jgi:uncharacterized protein (DUF1800 family)
MPAGRAATGSVHPAADMSNAAAIAVSRFGLGPRPGELAAAARNPVGWLKRQIHAPSATPAAFAGLSSGAERMGDFLRAREQRGQPGVEGLIRQSFRETYRQEASLRLRHQIETTEPFRERLVSFWANHFTVSVQRPPVFGLAGAFEREAIRPHVFGRFSDMLQAVARHPAMLVYLDNGQSIGPNSAVGLRRGRGLNENLARELLELHTLGVEGGYTQTDVRELAKILTGWTLARAEDPAAGSFRFVPAIHEPGGKTLLGRQFGHGGESDGEEALRMLSAHPATARHIATKLARHFIADDPPPAAVERLARVFRETDGNLAALSEAIVEQPESWAEPLPKIRTPQEFVIAALRATEFNGSGETILGTLRTLGQASFAAPSPSGWPDTAERWIGPEAVLRRAEWSMALGLRIAAIREPERLFAETIAPVAGRNTALAVARAPSAGDAIATLFASPEFQRR